MDKWDKHGTFFRFSISPFPIYLFAHLSLFSPVLPSSLHFLHASAYTPQHQRREILIHNQLCRIFDEARYFAKATASHHR